MLLHQLHWLKAPEGFSTSSPFWLSNAAIEWYRRTWSMNSFNLRIWPRD